ncbi:MAG: GntR family transcriptional regulator [Gammaproteobacteria bacterium]|jgi:DNA-binding GntR family transcriptional regulator
MTTPVSIPERLFEQLKSAIFDGDIPVGSKLSEPELARDYQVSRGALREAIGRLEACRLVTRKTNVGARVVELSVENLLEIFQVRESLEGMAARLAAQFITADEIIRLEALLETHAHDIESSEDQAYFQKEGDLDFHYSIVQASHNTTLFNLLCNDLYQLVRLYRYQFGMRSQRAKQAFSEHRHIVAAIKRGDGEMAEHIMRAHIRASRESVERIFIHESNDPLAAEVNA